MTALPEGRGGGLRLLQRLNTPTARFALRVGALLGLVGGAYHYSLITLLNGVSLQTPLAYLGLVPLVALFLVVVYTLAPKPDLDIHDRYIDYIIGVPLLLVALAIVVVVPIRLSTFFWLWRLDLISLPIFAAGAVALAFGVRALWRIRVPLGFLLLAWPPPYTLFLAAELQSFTSVTIAAARSVLHIVAVAQPLDAGDGSLFLVPNAVHPFVLSVSSACSGVNSVFGFLLVAASALAVVRGKLTARLTWLGAGIFLIWAFDLARILLIFAVGRAWGEQFAMDVMHPYLGLLFFNLGVLVMLLTMPLFRLKLRRLAIRGWLHRSEPIATAGTRTPFVVRPAVARAGVALLMLAVAGVLTGAANTRLPAYELFSHDLGPPRLQPLAVAEYRVPDWSLRQVNSYPWAHFFFGPDATWNRYNYGPGVAAFGQPLGSQARFLAPIVVDVISTSNLDTFSTYGIESCYRFHNFLIVEGRRVDLGAGVIAKAMTYRNRSTGFGTAVYWEWPVLDQGKQLYERVVLSMSDPGARLDPPSPSSGLLSSFQLSINDALEGNASISSVAGTNAASTRDFLTAFGHEVVMAAARSSSAKSGST